jgi:general secretion pathway protein I
MRTPCLRRQRAFTLVEVLVALTIIAVALVAALRGAMSLTSNAREARERMVATLLAENSLLELRFSRKLPDPGEVETDCTEGGIGFRCLRSVRPTPNPFFRRVEIRVRDSGGERTLADLMTLLPLSQ